MAALDRFVEAQGDSWLRARAELAAGAKRSHWMWFIFPQLAGLGSSPMAKFYAISGLREAGDYLRHGVLGNRLREATALMLRWAGKRGAVAILGEIDALKFRSSMTLFEVAAIASALDAGCFGCALDAFCQSRRDSRTLELLHVVSDRAKR